MRLLMPLGAAFLVALFSIPVDADNPAAVGQYNDGTKAGPVYQGVELNCHLPAYEHIKNIGSKVDGSGMCVMSSIEMAAIYQGMEEMRGLRDWCANEPGGAWPDKVARQIPAYCKAKGIPVPLFMQVETRDPSEVMKLIHKTGRMAAITYGQAHMTCCPHYDGQKFAVCLDNNRPGSWQWMSPSEMDRMMTRHGKAWIFVWLDSPPPPVPVIRDTK